MEKIKLSKDDFNETKLQRISVEYIPRQAVELRRIDTPMKDSLEKMENDGKKTMDKKIEKATKEVF